MEKKVIKDSTQDSVPPFSAKKASIASKVPSMANVSIHTPTQSVTNSIPSKDTVDRDDQPTAVIAPAGKLSVIYNI